MTSDDIRAHIYAYLLRTHGALPRGEVDADTLRAYLDEASL